MIFLNFKLFLGNFRKCSTTADCEVHNSSSWGIPEDVHCADHAGRGYKTCFCVSILKEADKDGSCETHRMAHFSYFNFFFFFVSCIFCCDRSFDAMRINLKWQEIMQVYHADSSNRRVRNVFILSTFTKYW